MLGRYFLILWALCAAPVVAQDNRVLLELFTSQGCSSCPPADAYVHKLAKRDDVIVLAYHVDYWDYIGWKDIFAKPEFTKRQKVYASTGNRRSIYTPQMIVNGQDAVVGSDIMAIMELVQHHKRFVDLIDMTVRQTNGRVEVQLSPKKAVPPAEIRLVQYETMAEVAITRGENAGKVMQYSNIVIGDAVVDRWSGNAKYKGAFDLGARKNIAVVVQVLGQGPVLASAILR